MFFGCDVVSTATRLVLTKPMSDQVLRKKASICRIPSVPIRFLNFTRVVESNI